MTRAFAPVLLPAMSLVASLVACMEAPNLARDPQPPVSYAVPVGMRVVDGATQWPAIAGSADGDLAVVSPDGTLTVFSSAGERRFSAEGLQRALAVNDGVVLVAAEGALRRYTLHGQRLADVRLSGENVAIGAHPGGGFVVSFEDDGDTHVAAVDASGGLDDVTTLTGWTSDDTRPVLIAVRADGVIGLLIHGPGSSQPAELLGVTLERDDPADAGVRTVLIAIEPDGRLLDAISFYTWGRLVELHADDFIQVISQETPIGSKMRSLVTDTTLGRVRLEAVSASTALLLGDVSEVMIIEGEKPAMAASDLVFILRPSTDGAWQDLVDEMNVIQVPVTEAGECRAFFVNAIRMHAVCAWPPFQSLAQYEDSGDSEAVGWAVSALRTELGI